jgi:hypothetical protein
VRRWSINQAVSSASSFSFFRSTILKSLPFGSRPLTESTLSVLSRSSWGELASQRVPAL